MNEDEEIVLAFCEESRENLDQLDRDLVNLESRGADRELMSRVFRAVHTLKGTCGFLGFSRLEALAHAGEDLLAALREGALELDAPATGSLLKLVDTVRGVLTQIEATATEPHDDHEALIAELRSHLSTGLVVGEAPPAVPAPSEEPASVAPTTENSVRVDVAVLDRLMDLVGELVLARGRLGALAVKDDEGPLADLYRDLRVVSGDLQDSVMTARLQPVGTITGKYHRIARDLAAALGKRVVVQLSGEDVGVDRAVNEALRDPLLHLVRNALDHGIETPAERIAAGKPPTGALRIRALHEGGRVQVEVSDDGRGIDVAGLRERAVRAGVLGAEAAAELSEAQALDLMFRAGLSTRDEVTSTSGRGVGMDVVRSAVDQLGGSVEVTSTPGEGAVFRLDVPLTLAIMPVLVTWCGGGRYAIPQVHLREVHQLDAVQVAERVDVVEGARLLRRRGRLLPLIDLADRLGVPPRRNGGLVAVVVETDSRRFGIVVDDVADTVDAVVKPLPRLLRSLQVYAGTTILGDGRPALVVDVAGLAGVAGIAVGSGEDHVDGPDASAVRAHEAGLLLATLPDGGQLAVRIAQVRRLESFAPERVERTGDVEVVQYGGEILPLVRVADALPERRQAGREQIPAAGAGLPAVVCETAVGAVGLIVATIDDVVPEPTVPRQPASRPGVEACVVVDDRVAELLDVEVLAALAGVGRAR